MSYGLQAKNQNNDVVIDSDFRNFVFKQKQVLSFSPVSERSGMTIINIARQTVTYYGGISPIIAIKTNGEVGITQLDISGSTYTWTFSANTATGCTVYIFDVPTTVSGTTGIQVFDGSSQCVFNSENKYMKVIDTFPITWGNSSWPTVTRTYTSGDYAVAIGCPRTVRIIGGSADTDAITASATTVTVKYGIAEHTAFVRTLGTFNGDNVVTGLTINVAGL